MTSISVNINARQRCIIFALLQIEGHITLNQLSKETGLTSRIIRYNLDTVRAWFKNEGIQLTLRPGYGIEINLSKQNRKRLLNKMSMSSDEGLILTRGQRQRIILFELLTTNKPVTYQELSVNEDISRATIIHDVADMQKWLNAYRLTLQRTQNKGIMITGSESSRRHALLNLIHEELGDKKWYSLWFQPDFKSILDKSLPPTLEKYLESLPLSYAYSAVIHLEHLVGTQMALYSQIEALLYLSISIDAIRRGNVLTSLEESDVQSEIELEAARFILSEISRKFSVKITDEECRMLAIFLLAAKWEEDNITQPQEMLPVLGEECVQYAKSIVEYCSNQLHPLLRVDQELLTGLAAHLKPVVQRIRYDLPILNDCLEQIQVNYPEIYRCAKAGSQILEKDIKRPVPDNEVGFITMYLAAALTRLQTQDKSPHTVIILGDGIRAKATYLKSRLEYEFPMLEVQDVLNGLPKNTEALSKADLILSLIPAEFPGLSTITVSPFLSNSEKHAIHNWINEREEKSHRQFIVSEKKPDLVDVFLPQNIVFRQSVENWQEAVYAASQPLLEKDLILPSYPEAMIKIIEEYGPYMVLSPGVILLHARPIDGVNQVCLSLLILEKGVSFSETSGPLDLAFVLGAADDTHHLNVLYQLWSLIYREDFLSALRAAQTPTDVLRTVWNFANEPIPLSEVQQLS